MEPEAKECLKSILDAEVFEVGIITKKSQPWLCASPDGIAFSKDGELSILEVKCPSSCAGKEIKVPYLENGRLKKSHPYYTQIQVQLYCSELKSALLFVYSTAEHKLVKIEKDNFFLCNLVPSLERIYFQRILPAIVEKHCSST